MAAWVRWREQSVHGISFVFPLEEKVSTGVYVEGSNCKGKRVLVKGLAIDLAKAVHCR